MNKIKRIIGISIFVLLIVVLIYFAFFVLPNRNKSVRGKKIDTIKFDYVLYERDKTIYKDTFNKLKEELNKDEINYEKYAEYISKLLIIDLYTLDNKASKNDVGGVQFVMDNIEENFILNASNTMYKYIGTSDIKMPEVVSIDLVELNEYTYTIENKDYQGYEVKLKWDYKEDLDYDKEGIVYVVKDEDKLVVVEKK